jgi:hypothetical protein
MATQFWLVTTQGKLKHAGASGDDISTFTSVTQDSPAKALAKCRDQQPERWWALIFAMKITAADAKILEGS